MTALSARRDHLLAVNARLSVPLAPPTAPTGAPQPTSPASPHDITGNAALYVLYSV